MLAYLKRLVTTGAAYQAGDMLAKAIAVFTLPLYTRHVPTGDYGAYTTLVSFVVLASIPLRLGIDTAFVRFYYDDPDRERRRRLAAGATAIVATTTTIAAAVCIAAAQPLSKLVLGYHDATLFALATLGLWAFTNLEMAYAQLRVEERARTYLRASVANVLMTVIFTLALVVAANERARGLLLGNFGASAVIVLALWWVLREQTWVPLLRRARARLRRAATEPLLPRREVRALFGFGLPIVPADAITYALQVADRAYLFRVISHAAAGLYAVALSLATVVFVFVRGFQYAWPPLAYSIGSDEEASQLYALVTTYYVLATGIVVAAVALLGRWLVRLLAAPSFFGAHRALPWLALGWSLYGLLQVFIVISGRARVTRRNVPAAALGLAANVGLLIALVPRGGADLGIAGAGLALCGAYLVMLVVLYLLTRDVFRVRFEWGRLARLIVVLGGVAVSGELLLPTHGFAGFVLRALWLGLAPLLLLASGFMTARELRRVRQLVALVRARYAAPRARL